MSINILDLGINNLSSITKAIKDLSKYEVNVISNADDWADAELIVLPGVGSFGKAISNMKERGFFDLLKSEQQNGTRIAGVCLGMQLLTRESAESPGVEGLSFIDAEVSLLPANSGERVPHMGWNNVNQINTDNFFRNSDGRDFYFVHSYAVLGLTKFTIGQTDFGTNAISSALQFENVVGFQFHPEKSSSAGRSLLLDLVEWAHA